MSKIKTALNILFSKNVALGPAIFYLLRRWKILNICNDKLFVNIGYYLTFGTKLNLSNPQTFNQKLNWLKIYNRNPEYTHYVDKYRVKEFVSKKIGKEYIFRFDLSCPDAYHGGIDGGVILVIHNKSCSLVADFPVRPGIYSAACSKLHSAYLGYHASFKGVCDTIGCHSSLCLFSRKICSGAS